MKKLLSIMALFVISLLTVSMVSAVSAGSTLGGLTDSSVLLKVNDKLVGNFQQLTVEKGETLDIEVGLFNQDNGDTTDDSAKDIEVVARLTGYEYSDYVSLEDSTPLFDVKEGTTKFVNLELTVPKDLNTEDAQEGKYTLRVLVLDRNSENIIKKEYILNVESPRHSLDIEDVSFSPGLTVKAGRSLLANVLVENLGEKTEEDVKVTVAVSELGISATEYINEIEPTANEDVSEDLFLSIPATTAAGDYEVKVSVKYDNYETITKTYTLHVLADERYNSDALVLAVGPDPQTVAVGNTVTYGIALTNAGVSSQAYVLEAAAGWATTSLSDNVVVLEPGKNAVVYLEVTPTSAAAGENVLSFVVKSGEGNVLETVALRANVVVSTQETADTNLNLRNGLEIALIILVVLLVIIGLIVGFSRLRKDDEDEAYY